MTKATAKAAVNPTPNSLVVWKTFDKYSALYHAGRSLQNGEAGADIVCYNANGNNRVGLIRFFKDQSIMPANQLGSDGTITLYYEMSRYNDVVTTLRYEKPLYLAVNTKTGFGYLGCGELEPVGEEE
jgi:hypothetical protein